MGNVIAEKHDLTPGYQEYAKMTSQFPFLF